MRDMTRRFALIMTRPADESFEAFVSYRENTSLKLTKSKKVLIKKDLVDEWKKFWEKINSKSNKKFTAGNFSEYVN